MKLVILLSLSGGNSNSITVNLAGVTPGTVTLYFGVKAVNAVGSSITSNATAVPATSSTAKLLKITNLVLIMKVLLISHHKKNAKKEINKLNLIPQLK